MGTVIYTYESLCKTMKEMERKAQKSRLRPEEAAIGVATAYAIDLIEIGKDIGKPLDLSVHTVNNLGECMMRAHLSNMKGGKTIEESREILAKMLASYELFTLINDFGCLEDIPEKKCLINITVLSNVMMPKPKLVIETIPDARGKTYRFDIYKLAQDTMQLFQLGEPGKGDGVFYAGTLQPFHHRVNTELVKNIEKVVKSMEDR